MFAPHMANVGPNVPERVAGTMKRLMADLVQTYGVNPDDVISEVLNFFAQEEAPKGQDAA